MARYKSEAHRINIEAQAMSQDERRAMVAEAALMLGPAAAAALATRFGVSFDHPTSVPPGKRTRGFRKRV